MMTGRMRFPARYLLPAAVLAAIAGCSDPWGPDTGISITHPPAGGAEADQSYIIQWTLSEDPYDDQSITLFVDSDLDPGTGLIQIADSLSSESTGFLWDCSLFPEGNYYVRAVLHEGGWSTSDYSEGAVVVVHRGALREHCASGGLSSH